MRYLDPKADMIFKLVFGEHPDLVKSLLNALLPLEAGQEIEEIEYLSPEMIPETPLNKFSIVDVRCRDNLGRQFIVEMQMVWSAEFRQRVLFNASKAYVRQLGPSEDYRLLQPVYSLNLVNDLFEPDLQGYYHYYRLVHTEHNDKVIDGLHLVFVELPKYTPTTYKEKKMKVLWLRFLTEIDEKTRQVPEELLANPDIQKAVAVVEESAFTEAQLLGYEKFWDGVRIEKTLINSALRAEERGMEKGMKKGMQEGMEKGMQEGMEKGMQKGMQEGMEKGLEEGMLKGMEKGREESMEDVALSMIADKLPYATISKYTGLSVEKIQELAKKDLRH